MASQFSKGEQELRKTWNSKNQQNKNFSTSGASRNVIDYQNTMNQMLCAQAQDLHQSRMSQQEVPRTNSNLADGTDIYMRSPSQSSQRSNSPMEIDEEVPRTNSNLADGTDIYMRSPSQSSQRSNSPMEIDAGVPGDDWNSAHGSMRTDINMQRPSSFSQLFNSQPAGNISTPYLPPGSDVFSCSTGTMNVQPLAQHPPYGQLVGHGQPVSLSNFGILLPLLPYFVPGSHSSTLPSAGLPPCNCRQKYEAQIYLGNIVPCPTCGVANK